LLPKNSVYSESQQENVDAENFRGQYQAENAQNFRSSEKSKRERFLGLEKIFLKT